MRIKKDKVCKVINIPVTQQELNALQLLVKS